MKFKVDFDNGAYHTICENSTLSVILQEPYDLEIDDSELDALGLMWKPKDAPYWQVGDFAKCPDGKVRRVTYVNQYDGLHFHDNSTRTQMTECTRVAKPERPELPVGWNMQLVDKLKKEIDDWRKLTGEM